MSLDIDSWLDRIGLGQYAGVFRSNEIDASLVRGLTGDELKEMGIAALGHRNCWMPSQRLALRLSPRRPAPSRRSPSQMR